MAKQSGVLRDKDNVAILNAIRDDGTKEYYRRIPKATQANLAQVLRSLTDNPPAYNEFIDSLVNRIGTVVTRNITWKNRLAKFKRQKIEYGDTIEEAQVGLINSHVYSPERDYLERELFGKHEAPMEVSFHKRNRQEYYPITINEAQLQAAVLNPDGLSPFVHQLLTAPTTSDEWDEFLATCALFSEYEKNGGFYHVHVPDLRATTATEADAKAALRKMRAMAGTITFPSTRYNAAHMHVTADPGDLELFITPEAMATIDVEALAGAFNVDKANMVGRTTIIPAEHFGIEGCQAIMTTRDFFMIADNKLQNTTQYNPVSLGTNYFLHHWEIISASRFTPAIMFTTGADDQHIEIQPKVASLGAGTVKDAEGNDVTKAEPGQNVVVNFPIEGTDVAGAEIGVDYEVSGNKDRRTKIDNEGVLSIGIKETAETLTVTGTCTIVDPANPKAAAKTATQSVTGNVAHAAKDWPKP